MKQPNDILKKCEKWFFTERNDTQYTTDVNEKLFQTENLWMYCMLCRHWWLWAVYIQCMFCHRWLSLTIDDAPALRLINKCIIYNICYVKTLARHNSLQCNKLECKSIYTLQRLGLIWTVKIRRFFSLFTRIFDCIVSRQIDR